ncbi:protein GrpE [Alicyclobacillus hesperidum]|uniref:Protein GrpE n=1 Tax=Alicyclobacillus hesperidum TaxID=89784 RepID=A0A1H2U9Q1_9BACL|nr:nucleotide exchange factor GrpE [Alicyclobacillus hesperidum]GLV14141.1 protein GrpE [Alicyclobacillus hesperidum]SDW52922.1 molecular chaperone GrpE [Alicyclobacillus hesperidum]
MTEDSTKQSDAEPMVDDAQATVNKEQQADLAAAEHDVDAAELAREDISFDEDGVSETARDPRDAQIEELTQQLLRTRADFDNFRRRTRQEREELTQFATKKLLGDLLPVIDNFDRAMAAFDQVDEPQLKTGIEMVHRQLQQLLGQYGVEAMAAEGATFDPALHEAVMQESVEGTEPGVVLQVLQKGYTIHGKVLRPAMVKVSV